MKQTIIIYILSVTCSSAFAQGERKHIREGNKQYEKKQYEDAEISYLKALDKNGKSYEGTFNLGDAFYKEKKYEEAANSFDMLTHQEKDKETSARAYHNMGNSLLQSKKYEESIRAYKNALKNNPGDSDTKYNLAYAQAMLKQQQEQQNQDKNQENKQEQEDKDKQKDKNQQEKQDKKDEQKQNKENEQEQTKQKEQQKQPRPEQISKEDAKRLLEALNNEEKDVQEKLKKKDLKATKVKIEKDW